MRKILIIILAVVAGAGTLLASDIKIDGIWYRFDDNKKTAMVDYSGTAIIHGADTCSNTYAYVGDVIIPPSVVYNDVEYSVTSIGGYAFYDCKSLTSVSIPNSVTSIGWQAFCRCKSLLSPEIPESVTIIRASAFQGCASLTTISLSRNITRIEDGVFSGCSNLTEINISAENENYSSIDGVLFNKEQTTLICYPQGKQGAYSIPNSVTTIGESAFSSCDGLTEITIPNSVTTIGKFAFSFCTNLTSVEIPNSEIEIGASAFYGCVGVMSIEVPADVTAIGDDAFSKVANIVYDGSLIGAPWGAKTQNGYVEGFFVYSDEKKTCLKACSNMAKGEISIPNSVTWVGEHSFEGCEKITTVEIPESVTGFGWEAFRGCQGLTKVVIPNSVTMLNYSLFMDCTSLESVSIGSGVRYIVNGMFSSCTNLKNVVIPNSVITIEEGAFSWCSSLPRIDIPNSVTRIEGSAFNGCSGLTNIEIPNSVISVGGGVFRDCSSLTDVKIGSSVESIGQWAFSGCNSLTDINVSATNNNYSSIEGVLFNKDQTTLICYPQGKQGVYSIPEGVKKVGEGAFYECVNLTSIEMPESVTLIENFAFEGCENLTVLNLSNRVEGIGSYAFARCIGLTDVTIPNSVTNIEQYAFENCKALERVTLSNHMTSIAEGTFEYCENLKSIDIPYGVTEIGYSAFNECTSLTSVTLPASLTTIARLAFWGCPRITSIYNYAATPQVIDDLEVFDGTESTPGVNKSECTLYVPKDAIELYGQIQYGWLDFINVKPIQASEAAVTELRAEPSAYSVVVEWPAVTGATVYTIEIRKGEELVCTISFNGDGQLLSIDFTKKARPNELKNALQTATGWKYTISGLEAGTTYSYTIVAKNGATELFNQTKQFTTTMPTAIEEVESQESRVGSRKTLRGGQLYILRGENIYTVTGQEVR